MRANEKMKGLKSRYHQNPNDSYSEDESTGYEELRPFNIEKLQKYFNIQPKEIFIRQDTDKIKLRKSLVQRNFRPLAQFVSSTPSRDVPEQFNKSSVISPILYEQNKAEKSSDECSASKSTLKGTDIHKRSLTQRHIGRSSRKQQEFKNGDKHENIFAKERSITTQSQVLSLSKSTLKQSDEHKRSRQQHNGSFKNNSSKHREKRELKNDTSGRDRNFPESLVREKSIRTRSQVLSEEEEEESLSESTLKEPDVHERSSRHNAGLKKNVQKHREQRELEYDKDKSFPKSPVRIKSVRQHSQILSEKAGESSLLECTLKEFDTHKRQRPSRQQQNDSNKIITRRSLSQKREDQQQKLENVESDKLSNFLASSKKNESNIETENALHRQNNNSLIQDYRLPNCVETDGVMLTPQSDKSNQLTIRKREKKEVNSNVGETNKKKKEELLLTHREESELENDRSGIDRNFPGRDRSDGDRNFPESPVREKSVRKSSQVLSEKEEESSLSELTLKEPNAHKRSSRYNVGLKKNSQKHREQRELEYDTDKSFPQSAVRTKSVRQHSQILSEEEDDSSSSTLKEFDARKRQRPSRQQQNNSNKIITRRSLSQKREQEQQESVKNTQLPPIQKKAQKEVNSNISERSKRKKEELLLTLPVNKGEKNKNISGCKIKEKVKDIYQRRFNSSVYKDNYKTGSAESDFIDKAERLNVVINNLMSSQNENLPINASERIQSDSETTTESIVDDAILPCTENKRQRMTMLDKNKAREKVNIASTSKTTNKNRKVIEKKELPKKKNAKMKNQKGREVEENEVNSEPIGFRRSTREKKPRKITMPLVIYVDEKMKLDLTIDKYTKKNLKHNYEGGVAAKLKDNGRQLRTQKKKDIIKSLPGSSKETSKSRRVKVTGLEDADNDSQLEREHQFDLDEYPSSPLGHRNRRETNHMAIPINNSVMKLEWFNDSKKKLQELEIDSSNTSDVQVMNSINVPSVAASSYLVIGPSGFTQSKISKKYSLMFCVIEGTVNVALQDRFCTGGPTSCFFIPSGSKFSIKNLSERKNLVLFRVRMAQ